MLANIDKFLIIELQEGGYDIDFKKFKEIYTKSRKRPECIARAEENRKFNEDFFKEFMSDKK